MKIFNWMRNKLNAKENINKPAEPLSQYENKSCKEELNDWPNTLLAIGTFGNSKLKEQEKSKTQGNIPAKQDPLDNVTSEEFVEIDKVLRQLVNKNDSTFSVEPEKQNILLKKILNSITKNELINDEGGNKGARLQRTTSLVYRGGNDICMDKKNSGLRQKSLTFLLKKVFLCSGGFESGPMLSGPLRLPEPKLNKSIMEKILRAMLHKKIYPQRPDPNATPKKYLEKPETESDEDEYDDNCDESIWDKTDSEYIVLEI